MGCTTCSGNPNTWCTQCMPAEDTWVAPVDKLPDVFMGDRDHMYLLPNGDLFILSPDRTKWIKVNGTGNTTAYDDTEIKKRITDLENRPDKDTITTVTQGKRIRVTKNGNDYTVSGTPLRAINIAEGGKEPLVSLGINNDGDTFTLNTLKLAEELGKLQKKEDRPVTPSGVTTFFAKGDISGNGNSQGVKVTKDKIVNADTIKVGDIVTDSYWNKDLFNIGMFKVASVDGNTVTLNGVNDLTYNHPKQSLTLSDRVLSISDGNSVTLPSDNQTLTLNGNTLSISNGNSIELPASVEPKEYRARGNGLLLDADGTFHIEMATDTARQVPYNTKNGGFFKKLTPENRTIFKPDFGYDTLDNQLYSIDNDGTIRRNTILEAGLILDYAGSYDYGDLHKSFSSESVTLSVLSTSSQGISGSASFIQPQELKLEVGILAIWNSNNKVVFRFTPKIIWTIITESKAEHYTHFITKEELDSEEPIEIEVKKNEEVIGRLNMTIKNAKFFMQSVQGTVVLKNPTDNKYYYLPRLN